MVLEEGYPLSRRGSSSSIGCLRISNSEAGIGGSPILGQCGNDVIIEEGRDAGIAGKRLLNAGDEGAGGGPPRYSGAQVTFPEKGDVI